MCQGNMVSLRNPKKLRKDKEFIEGDKYNNDTQLAKQMGEKRTCHNWFSRDLIILKPNKDIRKKDSIGQFLSFIQMQKFLTRY